MARAKGCPFPSMPRIQGSSWGDLQGAAGRDAQGSAHCSDSALLGSPLKQYHYFRDTNESKFFVCEGAGPNGGGIRHLWKLSDAVDAPPAPPRPLPTQPCHQQLEACRDNSPGSVFNSLVFIYIQIRG